MIAWVIVIAIIVFAVVGVVIVTTSALRLWSAYERNSHIAEAAGRWLAASMAAVAEHGAEWISAISAIAVGVATFLLWQSTKVLSRSTNVQQTTDGPFLTVSLYPGVRMEPAPITLANGQELKYGEYPASFLAQEQANPNLSGTLSAAGSAKYINLIVHNRATKPSSVATDIKIKTVLFFGGQSTPHPFSISRDFSFPLIEANNVDAGRLYNIAGLTSYQIQILEVFYRDVMGRDRRAATGLAAITVNATGESSNLIKLFKPRKGEFTDAVDD